MMRRQWIAAALAALLLLSALPCAATAASALRKPSQMDNGYWVDAYRYYIDYLSDVNGHAMLADFDLDGTPELMVCSEDVPHVGGAGRFVKYTGSDYTSYYDDHLVGWDDQYYLVLDGGSYAWYVEHSYANLGMYYTEISKLSFSRNMAPSETAWLKVDGDLENGPTSFIIKSREVSESEYSREEAKWTGMTKLFSFNLLNYPYPSSWSSATSQNSVLNKSGGTKPGSGQKKAKELYRVRRSWSDAASQVGAFEVLSNAIAMADNYPGYSVYDSYGNVVYTSGTGGSGGGSGGGYEESGSFLVKVSRSDLNIRSGPGTNYSVVGQTGVGVFTIVATASGQGSASGWGKLKSGAGWIALDLVTRQ